jgi:hypothetical protein
MGLTGIMVFVYSMHHPHIYVKKYFSYFLLINVLNVVYILLFSHTTNEVSYAFARFITFSVIMIGVYKYRAYYIKSYTNLLYTLLVVILLVGIVLHPPSGGRYSGLFGNSNSLGIVSALLFGIVYLKNKWIRWDILVIIFALMLVLLSGSRNALLGIVIAFFLKGSFSIKNVIGLFLGLLIFVGSSAYLSSNYKGNTGLDRLISSSKKDDVFAGREMEFILGMKTVMLSPLVGNGIDKYGYIADKLIPDYLKRRQFIPSPHNSYIGIWNQYGLFVGTFLILLLFYQIYKVYRWKTKDNSLFFVMFYLAISASFEAYLFAINGFETMVFWTAYAINMVAYHDRKYQTNNLDEVIV